MPWFLILYSSTGHYILSFGQKIMNSPKDAELFSFLEWPKNNLRWIKFDFFTFSLEKIFANFYENLDQLLNFPLP